MNSTFVGISCGYHDSAAVLVDDGEIVAAAQEERFTRVKQDPGFPGQALRWCLRETGLTSLDMVNLMLAIEAEFDIEIPQSAMTPDNFDTVMAIENLVSVTAKAA